MAEYRKDIPEVPERLKERPIQNGYPVPWFVAEIDGRYDFRVAGEDKLRKALRHKLCWVCGKPLGANLTFVTGPMCAINRTISEPPSHQECAEWSAKACPFLCERQEERRVGHLPEDRKEPGGIAIARNPKAVAIWTTRSYEVFTVSNGILFQMGEPTQVLWMREGRTATRQDVLDSINSGFPLLLEMAEKDGEDAVAELHSMRDRIEPLLPKE